MNPVKLGLLIGGLLIGVPSVARLAYKDIKFRRGLLVGLLKFVPLVALVGGSTCAITNYVYDTRKPMAGQHVVEPTDQVGESGTWYIFTWLTWGVPWYAGAMYGGMVGVAFALFDGLSGRDDETELEQYRRLYEQGDLNKEEFERIRARLEGAIGPKRDASPPSTTPEQHPEGTPADGFREGTPGKSANP